MNVMTPVCVCPTCGQPVRSNKIRSIFVDASIPLAVCDGVQADLWRKEAQVLELLVSKYPARVSAEQIIWHLYGDDPDGGPEGNVYQAHVSRLRAKLSKAGWPWKISTVRQLGYRLEAAEDAT